MTSDGFHWTTSVTIEKWDDEQDRDAGLPPDRVETYEGNVGLNEGINEIWQLVTAAGGTAFGATTLLRVGSNAGPTAESASNTALDTSLGSVTVAAAPTFGAQSVTWTGTFGAGTATGAWNEWTVENTAGKNLNRKVTSMGTKGAGASWTFTPTLSMV